jgi:hypothetical protein
MPTYSLHNEETGEDFEEFMSFSELEKHLKKFPHIKQNLTAPALGYSTNTGKKPDDGFRDRLREIKKSHSRGFTKANINTF